MVPVFGTIAVVAVKLTRPLKSADRVFAAAVPIYRGAYDHVFQHWPVNPTNIRGEFTGHPAGDYSSTAHQQHQ